MTRYFAAYEVTKKVLTPEGQSPSELNLGAIIVAGGTAGVAMWSIAIPPDVSCSLRMRGGGWRLTKNGDRLSSLAFSLHQLELILGSWTAHGRRSLLMASRRCGRASGPRWLEYVPLLRDNGSLF